MKLKHFNVELGCQIFSSCADPARLRILNLIVQSGGLCVRDVEHVLSFTQTKTSRHLAYLKNTGILYAHRENQWVIYRVKEEIMDIIRQLLEFVQHDTLLKNDWQTYQDMYSTHQLAINKLNSTM